MPSTDVPSPYRYTGTVKPEWLDENGHMNVAFYMSAFDDGGEVMFADPGIGWEYTRSGKGTIFVVSSKVDYRAELLADEKFEVTTQLINHNAKLIHAYYTVSHAEAGYVAATAEIIYLHVDLQTRRSATMPDKVCQRLEQILQAHRELPTPKGLGEGIGIKT